MQSREMICNSDSDGMVSRLICVLLLSAYLLAVGSDATADAAFTTNISSDSTLPTPTSVSQAANVYNIDGGTIQGSNLFHSFGFFSVGTGHIASFNGPGGIANILGRVTGGQASMIDGTIRSTITGANLFLMNPKGIVLGPKASLDVTGSVHFSTADYLRLTDGAQFTAIPDLVKDSLLTTAPVAAFGFLGPTPGELAYPAGIFIQESVLKVPAGRSLSFIGGDIDITGGPLGFFSAPAGRVNLASVASAGEVLFPSLQYGQNINGASFSDFGNISLSQLALIDVSGNPGGAVVIRGGTLMVDNSQVFADTLGAINGAPVAIDIDTSKSIVLTNGGDQFMILAATFGDGWGGDIRINTNTLELTNSASIGTLTLGRGQGGKFEITVEDLRIVGGGSTDTVLVAETRGPGAAGKLQIDTGNLEIRGELGSAYIDTDTTGTGRGGDLEVKADSIFLRSTSLIPDIAGLFSGSSSGGSTGTIQVTTGLLEIRGGAQIKTAVGIGAGQGGDITVQADRILIDGEGVQSTQGDVGGILASVFGNDQTTTGKGGNVTVISNDLELTNFGTINTFTESFGDGGKLTIDTQRLRITNGGFLNSSAFGIGNGGTINVTADLIELSGPSPNHIVVSPDPLDPLNGIVFTERNFTGIFGVAGLLGGNAGNILITAKELRVLEGAQISTQTFGPGAGGTITINADTIGISGGEPARGLKSTITADAMVFSGLEMLASGKGGDVVLRAQSIDLSNGAEVTAKSFGTGNAGDIRITADKVVLKDSTVSTEALNAAGGSIDILEGRLLHLSQSAVTTSVTTGVGNSGNITVNTDVVILDHSHITANAFGGAGGNIKITAGIFLIDPDSAITASSTLGVSGTITIESAISDLSGSLVPLPENFLQAGALVSSRCAAGVAGGSTSSFVVAGRDGIPMEPGGLLPSPVAPAGAIGVASAKPAADVKTSGLAPGPLLALNTWGQDLNSGCVQ